MDKQTNAKIELCGIPCEFNSGGFRACIKRDDRVSYLSQINFPTVDAAQRYAALVFTGAKPGYRR